MTQGNTAPWLPFDEPQRTLQDFHDDLSQEIARLRRNHPALRPGRKEPFILALFLLIYRLGFLS